MSEVSTCSGSVVRVSGQGQWSGSGLWLGFGVRFRVRFRVRVRVRVRVRGLERGLHLPLEPRSQHAFALVEHLQPCKARADGARAAVKRQAQQRQESAEVGRGANLQRRVGGLESIRLVLLSPQLTRQLLQPLLDR